MSRLKLLAICVLLAVVAFSATNRTATQAWGGKKPTSPKTTSYTSCAPVNSTHTTNASADTVYFVKSTGGLNVRSGHSTSSCIITTQGYQANVVLVPVTSSTPSNSYYDGTYHWLLVAYQQYACGSCTNLDWKHTGWVADVNLAVMVTGFKCISSTGCGNNVDVSVTLPSQSGNCAAYLNGQSNSYCIYNKSYPNYNSGHVESGYVSDYFFTVSVGAYDIDPDWFMYYFHATTRSIQQGQGDQASYYWQNDWFAY